jgi:hypothetical protein
MARALSDAVLSWELFQDYDRERGSWIEQAANDEDFFFGKQWTDQEIKTLTEKGMAPLVVNRTMPVIQQEVAIFLAKRPSFKYFPADDYGDVDTAKIFSDCAQHVWHISNGDSQYQQCIQDYFVTGAGYMQAYVDPYADEGRGEVLIKSVPIWDVYPDPNSREIDLSDARFVLVSRLIPKKTLMMMYPDKESAIKQIPTEEGPVSDHPGGNPNTDMYHSESITNYVESVGDNEKVRVIERYQKVRKKKYKIMDRATGKVYKVDKKPDSAALDAESSEIRAIPIYETRIEVVVTASNTTTLDKYTLKTPIYPVVPFYLHHRRNPYPCGDVMIIKGMQQETNKRRSILIHNATLSGNYRIMAEKNSIANKEEFERKGSQPGFILEYLNTGGEPPKELLPQQLPAAWIQLEQEGKADIEYALSVFAHQMGSGADAPDTYRGLLALEEKGQQKIQHKARHARQALRNLGLVTLHLIQQTYSPQKIIRVVGEENEKVRQTVVNQIEVDPFTGETRTINDLTVGSYDLMVGDGTSMPTNRMAMLQQYLEMYQLGIVDKAEVIKKTDIEDREAMLDRMGEVQQLQAQLSQLEESLKDLEGLNQTLRRNLQQQEIHAGAQKVMMAGERELMQTQAAEQLKRQRLKDELNLLQEKIALAERSAKAAITNKVEQTSAQMGLIKLKAEMEADIERRRKQSTD